jgi:hypothetical protein
MRCTGHGKGEYAEFTVFVKPERRGRPGKPTRVWVGDINMDLESVGVMLRTELNCELVVNTNG